MWLMGLGRVKTKSDLVVMPSGRQILRSLDHLVGDSEQRRRYDKIQHARGLHIDPQFELALQAVNARLDGVTPEKNFVLRSAQAVGPVHSASLRPNV
jgi:hypothetical protein